jgi:hypothetical protein
MSAITYFVLDSGWTIGGSEILDEPRKRIREPLDPGKRRAEEPSKNRFEELERTYRSLLTSNDGEVRTC